MEINVGADAAADAGRSIGRRLAAAVRRRGTATLALSGGSTAPPMIAVLARADLPWSQVSVWQVDERIAPDGHEARNVTQLDPLVELGCRVRPMPVTAGDLRRAANRYGGTLPERFDVVHLGVGDDGHTASWPPGQPEVPSSVRPVELVDTFNGWPRMTVTRSVVNSARSRVVLATGAAKRPMIERWLLLDDELPITAVRRTRTSVFLDPAAAPTAPSHPTRPGGDPPEAGRHPSR